MSNQPWYLYNIVVPFGNSHFDVGLGGSHDMDIGAPPNYPVTALLSGTVCDIPEPQPNWGKQLGLRLDSPYNGIPYMAYLHLSAINPQLAIGHHVNGGDVIGWVGGATNEAQYAGTSNPTGQNFLNDISTSSRVQVGIALMRGPVYGSGTGWETFPPIDKSLDPTPIIEAARQKFLSPPVLPPGWSWDGKTLHTPGADLVLGFAAYVYKKLLAGQWEADDYPDKPQYYTARLEDSNPDLGDGDQIITKKHMLGYPHNPQGAVAHLKDTVIEEYVGKELATARANVEKYYTLVKQQSTQLQQLQQEIAQLKAQPAPSPQLLADVKEATVLSQQVATLLAKY